MTETTIWMKKPKVANTAGVSKKFKELDSDDVPKLNYLPVAVQTAIVQARGTRKREDVAQKLNVKVDEIKRLETSRTYQIDRGFIRRVERELGVKFDLPSK